ncbi:MAG: sigma 54-interacting transcriptional regulator [Acidobacteriia bacterium]|nr:sigma 54-interacting transcriptional regulator [Terriglobia bacterium]
MSDELIQISEGVLVQPRQYWDQADTLQAILNNISDGVMTYDSDFKITSFNQAAEEITGYTSAEAVGRSCKEIFRCSSCDTSCGLYTTMHTRVPERDCEVRLERKNGDVRIARISTAILKDSSGQVTGTVVTFRDISELMSMKKELYGRYQFHSIIGKSHKMQEIFALIEDVGESDATVLVLGESGTGKELIARAIHHQSRRSQFPFVKVNCSALAETLLESELFGHVKGAFTGAYRDKIGRFELAQQGSIFLDEIGDISPNIQLKLLRVLQEREVERVGDSKVINVDVRIIAATNRNLRQLVDEGKFREDLFYRLNVIPLSIPPLKDRKEDIPLLLDHFISQFNEQTEKNIAGITKEALNILMDYHWPGNIRQLENAIEHAFVKSHGKSLEPASLPVEILTTSKHYQAFQPEAKDERETIIASLQQAGWNKAKASRELGIDRVTLWRKMKKYNISAP